MLSAMRSNEVFAGMTPEESLAFLEAIRESAPKVCSIALTAAADAFKLRPQYLQRQPRKRQAEWMRKALGRRMMVPVAEEVLAEYFLEHQLELLTELLDAFGLEHEEGILQGSDFECPDKAVLEKAVEEFRGGEDKQHRELLLKAFAAQTSIEWPTLEGML